MTQSSQPRTPNPVALSPGGKGGSSDGLRFDERGLLPAIVQDADDGSVLMLGYMNREALAATRSSGQVHFFSRSRQTLWRKGETSGHALQLVGLAADCDGDALLVLARPLGPTCHTGDRSCFHAEIEGAERPSGISLAPLLAVLRQRKAERPEGSYTVKLLDNPDKALKKLVEEAIEVALAVKNNDRTNLVWEIADLLYHLAVVMVANDVAPREMNAELTRRSGGGT
jgi:phosphoribosyl-AMP cyclohydrolase / phosphoribosyl-ATP pyrophosphohydrolase